MSEQLTTIEEPLIERWSTLSRKDRLAAFMQWRLVMERTISSSNRAAAVPTPSSPTSLSHPHPTRLCPKAHPNHETALSTLGYWQLTIDYHFSLPKAPEKRLYSCSSHEHRWGRCRYG